MHNPVGFVLLTDEKYIEEFLSIFKTDKDVNVKNIQYAFSHTIEREGNKIIKTNPPRFYTTDEFILKKGTLPNVEEDIQTCFGLYLFNLFAIASVFGERIRYYNPSEGMTPGNIEHIQQVIVNKITENEITPKEFGQFQDRVYFLSYKGTLFTPGQSFEFVKVNKKVKEAKGKLIKAWKAAVEAGSDPTTSYITMVEKPLLAIAKEDLKGDPAWPIYGRGGKPKFGNVYKNCTVTMGPVYDPITGEFKVAENSFMEGVNNEDVPTFANIQISAAYARGIATQDGGSKTKQIFSAMQSVVLNKTRGSNCGSTRYIKKLITSKNLKANLSRYIVDEENKKIIKLSYKNASQFVGKVVKMRTNLFCRDEDFCNVCAGDYFYDIGVHNIGNTSTKSSSTMMNKSLKAMHDVSMDVVTINPFDYITKI
ncbi:MAG TPA: hypothetical protein PK507_01265 [bacterium]|nr:hypothetical protein [bacterium]